MIGLAEKTLAELESLAAELHEMISRDPQRSRAEVGDVEWEMEKRHWRNVATAFSGRIWLDAEVGIEEPA